MRIEPVTILLVVADDLARLRQADVYRALHEAGQVPATIGEQRDNVLAMARFIRTGRPDLDREVVSCLEDLEEDGIAGLLEGLAC